MKMFLFITIFLNALILANTASAKSFSDMFNIVFRNKLYYSSYVFLKKSVEKDLRVNNKRVSKVLDIIHPSVFIHDPDLDSFVDRKTQLDYPCLLYTSPSPRD